ncbi:vomeronasal type-2 receptor 26-like [Platysternon megacephalum]|uniref:Vomeronasal type-2 receptor 26-like n=1 Tax=Platysternon megacephalum TaxID=55544 RepID=A0A4D9DU92_9SAUR|nr:vomeronasal type-2 receptor 26-like [Platysternon megacephalum]
MMKRNLSSRKLKRLLGFNIFDYDPDDQYKLTEDTRQLGLVVCRGTSVVLICPQDGMEAIPNPFIQQQEG